MDCEIARCFETCNFEEIRLTEMEYEELLIRVENDEYVPTELEERVIFVTKKHRFFVTRRNRNNYLIYIEE